MTESSPQQLLLDLGAPRLPTLDNFLPGRNGESIHALRSLCMPDAPERYIYLWGAVGSGRSHLLRAIAARTASRYYRCSSIAGPYPDRLQALAWDQRTALWAIDDIDEAGAEEQLLLFNLINELRARPDSPLAIVAAGNVAPMHLALREDLRTRLGWGLVFQVHTLDDADKDAALVRHANSRGISLPAEVSHYLLTNFSRDMTTLISLVDALDVYAMQRHRALTLPLVREFTQQLALDQQRKTALDAI